MKQCLNFEDHLIWDFVSFYDKVKKLLFFSGAILP